MEGEITAEAERTEALQLLRIYQSQIEALSNQSALISLTYDETKHAMETISSYKDVKEAEEILIPVGSDMFIRGYSKISEKALLRVGADVFVDKSYDDILKELEERKNMLGDFRKKVESDLNSMENEVSKLIDRVQRP